MPKPGSELAVRLLLPLAVLSATACGALHHKNSIRLHVEIDRRANQDQPIALDVVAVRNKAVSASLLKLTALEWFDKRDQFRSDYPDGRQFQTQSWEWVPGQLVGELSVPFSVRPKDAFVFAKYSAGGENRARLASGQSATILLGERKMTVVTSPSQSKFRLPGKKLELPVKKK